MVAKLFSFLLSMILDEVNLIHKVSEDENRLGLLNDTYGRIKARSYDRYAPKKQLYLGNKCQVKDYPKPWQFWMIMLKSGNMDTLAARCPENGKKSEPFAPESRFPCFGEGWMNMPKMYHNCRQCQSPWMLMSRVKLSTTAPLISMSLGKRS